MQTKEELQKEYEELKAKMQKIRDEKQKIIDAQKKEKEALEKEKEASAKVVTQLVKTLHTDLSKQSEYVHKKVALEVYKLARDKYAKKK